MVRGWHPRHGGIRGADSVSNVGGAVGNGGVQRLCGVREVSGATVASHALTAWAASTGSAAPRRCPEHFSGVPGTESVSAVRRRGLRIRCICGLVARSAPAASRGSVASAAWSAAASTVRRRRPRSKWHRRRGRCVGNVGGAGQCRRRRGPRVGCVSGVGGALRTGGVEGVYGISVVGVSVTSRRDGGVCGAWVAALVRMASAVGASGMSAVRVIAVGGAIRASAAPAASMEVYGVSVVGGSVTSAARRRRLRCVGGVPGADGIGSVVGALGMSAVR
ncbi:hypothetical protein P7K49_017384 [Saguinus oedipus]|uniref:Uncharacterized protein n=1 Tax=Saguinus oedipus TaxID=9490 RepID=A0ABQ9V2C8_SAGOE|nr:hypothetical protein P7K49_017384 [Saguinus oedipus]